MLLPHLLNNETGCDWGKKASICDSLQCQHVQKDCIALGIPPVIEGPILRVGVMLTFNNVVP